MTPAAVIDVWQSSATEARVATILPDGCRDVIVRRGPDGRASVEVSSLDGTARQAAITGGQLLSGFRLRPGAHVDHDAIASIVASESPNDGHMRSLIEAYTTIDERVEVLLDELATGTQRRAESRSTLRRQQRLLGRAGLPAPNFWSRLARVRLAALDLGDEVPLADIAAQRGFSDQAHMSREIRAWFATTPGQLRRRNDLVAMIAQPAFATGEQISMR